ncbi:MAG: hypothetical protein HeimC3_49050 [Candidatus Heimdallarchaeota archaeon LC_3]|nr:MAG: hypothetical protein HeimC3_49050 [Candidatus Heimdallarchaeota archaeon LC_3]
MVVNKENGKTTYKERSFIRKRFVLIIPKRIREKINLKENEPVEISLDNDKIIIQRISADPFKKLSQFGKNITFSKEERKKAEKMLMKQIE